MRFGFNAFMAKLCVGFLEKDWVDTIRRKVLRMSQSSTETFCNFSQHMQAHNVLLVGTALHFTAEKIQQQLESGMDTSLATRIKHKKVSATVDLVVWVKEVKSVDEMMQQSMCDMCVMVTHEGGRRTGLSKPS